MNAVLLAAGYGTRIRSLFPDTPKALIEVGGRALIDHLLANLGRSGVVESALVVDQRSLSRTLCGAHVAASAPPLPTRVISDGTANEDERLGAQGDLQLALRRLHRGGRRAGGGPPTSCWPSSWPSRCASRASARRRSPCACACPTGGAWPAGTDACSWTPAGRIVDFEEKPERPKSNIASLAVYVLTPAARELLDDYLRDGGNRDAPGHFLSWLTRTTTVYGYVTDGGAYDVGTPESYADAQRAFRAMQDGSPG